MENKALMIGLTLVVLLGIGATTAYFLRPRAPTPIHKVALDAGASIAPEATPDAGVSTNPSEPAPVARRGSPDARLRALTKRASRSKLLRKWSMSQGILQRTAAAVRLVARGDTPKPVLGFISLDRRFIVEEQLLSKSEQKRTGEYERVFISPKSYARYDPITDALTSMKPEAMAFAYRKLRPDYNRAFSQVAARGERFEDVLTEAIRRLVNVEVPSGKIELKSKGAVYAFLDPKLEAMSPAEKQLIRMGPKNAQKIQRALRRFARSAGLRL